MAGSRAIGQGANSEANIEPDGELWAAGATVEAAGRLVGTIRDVARDLAGGAARL
jgi:hypothetical protein